jgi:hypothetical protein
MSKPALFVIDDKDDSLAAVEGELRKRCGHDYSIVSETSAPAAVDRLEALKAADRPVALVLVGPAAAGSGRSGGGVPQGFGGYEGEEPSRA